MVITLIEYTQFRRFQDVQAGEVGPVDRRPRVSKLLEEGHQAKVHLEQIVLVIARREAGLVSWWLLKGYTLSHQRQGRLSGSSPLR
jgi:hypothetical protein